MADVDGDGWHDLYFTTQLGSNRLYRNLGGNRFEDITESAGVGLTDQISVAASFADIDNDGHPDLFVTTVRHGNRLFRNRGDGRFEEITRRAGLDYSGHSSSAVFFDFDNDGWLDLFLVNVGKYTEEQRGRGDAHRESGGEFHARDCRRVITDPAIAVLTVKVERSRQWPITAQRCRALGGIRRWPER